MPGASPAPAKGKGGKAGKAGGKGAKGKGAKGKAKQRRGSRSSASSAASGGAEGGSASSPPAATGTPAAKEKAGKDKVGKAGKSAKGGKRAATPASVGKGKAKGRAKGKAKGGKGKGLGGSESAPALGSPADGDDAAPEVAEAEAEAAAAAAAAAAEAEAAAAAEAAAQVVPEPAPEPELTPEEAAAKAEAEAAAKAKEEAEYEASFTVTTRGPPKARARMPWDPPDSDEDAPPVVFDMADVADALRVDLNTLFVEPAPRPPRPVFRPPRGKKLSRAQRAELAAWDALYAVDAEAGYLDLSRVREEDVMDWKELQEARNKAAAAAGAVDSDEEDPARRAERLAQRRADARENATRARRDSTEAFRIASVYGGDLVLGDDTSAAVGADGPRWVDDRPTTALDALPDGSLPSLLPTATSLHLRQLSRTTSMAKYSTALAQHQEERRAAREARRAALEAAREADSAYSDVTAATRAPGSASSMQRPGTVGSIAPGSARGASGSGSGGGGAGGLGATTPAAGSRRGSGRVLSPLSPTSAGGAGGSMRGGLASPTASAAGSGRRKSRPGSGKAGRRPSSGGVRGRRPASPMRLPPIVDGQRLPDDGGKAGGGGGGGAVPATPSRRTRGGAGGGSTGSAADRAPASSPLTRPESAGSVASRASSPLLAESVDSPVTVRSGSTSPSASTVASRISGVAGGAGGARAARAGHVPADPAAASAFLADVLRPPDADIDEDEEGGEGDEWQWDEGETEMDKAYKRSARPPPPLRPARRDASDNAAVMSMGMGALPPARPFHVGGKRCAFGAAEAAVAEGALQDSHGYMVDMYGEGSSQARGVLNRLAHHYHDNGMYEEAVAMLERLIKLTEEMGNKGYDTFEVTPYLFQLAIVQEDRGTEHLDDAFAALERAYDLCSGKFSEMHPQVRNARRLVVRMFAKLGLWTAEVDYSML